MQIVLTNAALCLPGQVMRGTIVVQGGRIADVQPGDSALPGAIDCEGDHLLPGAVDLHTDNLERQVQPRSNARWPSRPAMLAHDAQCAASGITTVFDSLCLGDLGFEEERARTCAEGIADLAALAPAGLLRAEHYLHLRCEMPAPDTPALLERLVDHPLLRMVSLMDHTPGSGQYADIDSYVRLRAGNGEEAGDIRRSVDTLQSQRVRLRRGNRVALLDLLHGRPIAVASHDDRTEGEIVENLEDGIAISEFPVSEVAARCARHGGMKVIAGAPNLVRGGSHTGNVSVGDLLASGLVDALASDYAPVSLVHAAFMAAGLPGWHLPRAVALVSDAPARMVGLADRGRIEAGQRADLVRVRLHEGVPVIRRVWRGGERVI